MTYFKTYQANKKAESTLALKTLSENETLTLAISTSKDTGGARTIASVYISKNEGGYSVKTFVVFQDYMKTVMRHNIARVTDKAIESAHAAGLVAFESGEFMEQIRGQYAL